MADKDINKGYDGDNDSDDDQNDSHNDNQNDCQKDDHSTCDEKQTRKKIHQSKLCKQPKPSFFERMCNYLIKSFTNLSAHIVRISNTICRC